MKNNIPIFAAVSDQGTKYFLRKRNFLCPSDCCIVKIRGCSNPMIPTFSEDCSSLVGNWEANSFSYIIILIFHVSMTKEMKNYSGAKHSNAHVTPDCESVNPLAQLSQTNNSILPTKIGHQTTGTESNIEGDIRDHSVESNSQELNDIVGADISDSKINCPNTQGIDNVNESGVVGNNMAGSDNYVASQTNHVQENRGVTGISGTGHTINIYQCPQELINLLVKSINKKL